MLTGFSRLVLLPHHRVAGLKALYLHAFLHNFAMALVGIFVPLYLFRLTASLPAVVGYYLIHSALVVLTAVPAAFVVHRLGFRRSSVLGTVFIILTIFLLVAGGGRLDLLPWAAVFSGTAVCFYWLPYHLIFAEDGRVQHFGREVSLMMILSRLAQTSGPLLGGLIVTIFSFNALYLVALSLLLFSFLPLTVMIHHPIHRAPSWRDLWHYFKGSIARRWHWPFALTHFEIDVLDIVWPLFVFGIFGSYQTVGGVASAALLLSLVLLLFSGRLTDRWARGKLLGVGAISSAGAWLSLPFALTAGSVFVSSLLLKSVRVFFYVPFDALLYTRVAKEGVRGGLMFLVFREIALHGSRVLIFAGLLLGLSFGLPLPYLFYPAALALPLAAWSLRKLQV